MVGPNDAAAIVYHAVARPMQRGNAEDGSDDGAGQERHCHDGHGPHVGAVASHLPSKLDRGLRNLKVCLGVCMGEKHEDLHPVLATQHTAHKAFSSAPDRMAERAGAARTSCRSLSLLSTRRWNSCFEGGSETLSRSMAMNDDTDSEVGG